MADNKHNSPNAKMIKGAAIPAETDTQPVVNVDYERYAHHLDSADLTDAQKQEFLETLWNIICEFVSLGFGVHPLQQKRDSCGKLQNNPLVAPPRAADSIYLDDKFLTDSFKTFANHKDSLGKKGDS